MSCCAVAISNSPVFSPSSRVSNSPVFSPSRGTLSSPCSSSSSSLLPSSSSPFRVLRLQKSPSGLRVCSSKNTKEECVLSGFNPSSSSAAPPPPVSVSKRKRPAQIVIPISSLSFPVTEASSMTEIEVEKEEYSVYCKKGRREAMEDRYSAVVGIQEDPKQGFFGVFDGHGGSKAAEFAAQNMDKNIMNELNRRRTEEEEEEDIVEAVKRGYLTTDSEFLKEDLQGGCCSVTALIRNGDLVVSNAGDCRAVMSRGGIAESLTSDHRPSREDERERIVNQGGFVDLRRGVWRLQGSLAVSRGIGDRHLKQWVIAEPETKVIRIKQDCEFLVLASDGLWDKVGNQEAVDIARPLLMCGGGGGDTVAAAVLLACKKLAGLAVTRGSSDDISVMVIKLGKFV